jgi:hypothetical protein
VATSLADPRIVAPAEQQAAPGAPPEQPPPAAAPAAERECANCGAPMAAGQDWCLHCGASVPGSLGGTAPGWRSAAAILGAVAILVLAAAAAGYAALTKGPPRRSTVTATVAQAAPPPVAQPTTPIAPPALTTPKLGTPTTIKPPPLPLGAAKPPRIPLPIPGATPKPAATPRKPLAIPNAGEGTGSSEGGGSGAEGGASAEAGESNPSALVLDTNAASTYNPYNRPASAFGDPSLAIDGDPATGWSAQVDPATAPKMAVGLLLDLKSPQRLASLKLVTSTPGLTIQVFGASGQAPPSSITDPAWVALSHAQKLGKRHVAVKLKPLHGPARPLRFYVVWINRAPAGASHVSINEAEAFPPR